LLSLSDPKACAERLENFSSVAQDLQSKADQYGMDNNSSKAISKILLSDLKKKTSEVDSLKKSGP